MSILPFVHSLTFSFDLCNLTDSLQVTLLIKHSMLHVCTMIVKSYDLAKSVLNLL